jgi:hypothetical protein
MKPCAQLLAFSFFHFKFYRNIIRFVAFLNPNPRMVFVSAAVLLISLIYLLVGIYTQNELKREQEAEIQVVRGELEEAEMAFSEISDPIFARIAEVYGAEYAAEVEDGELCAGMPEEFLLLTLGDPEEVESSFTKGTRTEKWYYDRVTADTGQAGYKTEITIVNNKIADINTEEN